MLKMSNESRAFLENNCPDILGIDDVNSALDLLDIYIIKKGFLEPCDPNYYDYNEFGREAQHVYDDLYSSNDYLSSE